MKLTKNQRKMTIEYFATKCAEEMPVEEVDQEQHFTEGHLEAQKAVSRNLNPYVWVTLVNELLDAQQLDRDPGGFLNSVGVVDTEQARESWKTYLDGEIGTLIDELATAA